MHLTLEREMPRELRHAIRAYTPLWLQSCTFTHSLWDTMIHKSKHSQYRLAGSIAKTISYMYTGVASNLISIQFRVIDLLSGIPLCGIPPHHDITRSNWLIDAFSQTTCLKIDKSQTVNWKWMELGLWDGEVWKSNKCAFAFNERNLSVYAIMIWQVHSLLKLEGHSHALPAMLRPVIVCCHGNIQTS